MRIEHQGDVFILHTQGFSAVSRAYQAKEAGVMLLFFTLSSRDVVCERETTAGKDSCLGFSLLSMVRRN